MEEIDGAIEFLLNWINGDKKGPQRVLIYPTNKCNLKCKFCYQRLNPYENLQDLPKEKWLSITKELCEMGVQTIQISGGGEPLLSGDNVFDMMKIIKQNNVVGRLVNNGTMWTKEKVKFAVDLKWDHIIFSIDGDNSKTHDFLRGIDGAFEKTKTSISWFRDIKKQKNTETPLIEFSSVVTNKNYTQIKGIIKLAHELNVKVITFEPVFVSNPYVHNLKLDEKQRIEYTTKYVPAAIELAEKLRIITNLQVVQQVKFLEKTGSLKDKITGFLKQKEKIPKQEFLDLACYEPWLWPKIEADGRVGPCSTNMLKDVNIKDKTFSEIWFGKPFIEFRKKILLGDLPEGCENCVSTHVPMNKTIRKKLIERMKNG